MIPLPPLQEAQARHEAAKQAWLDLSFAVQAAEAKEKEYGAKIKEHQRLAENAGTEGGARAHLAQIATLKQGLHVLARELASLNAKRAAANTAYVTAMVVWMRLQQEATTARSLLRIHTRGSGDTDQTQQRAADDKAPTAYQVVMAQDQAAKALQALQALVGEAGAQRCADDPTYKPDWVRT